MMGASIQQQPLPDQPDDAGGLSSHAFERGRWTHSGADIERFFARFVPAQYETGFIWRCAVIGKGEEARAIPWDQRSADERIIIARNAEVLLELFEETAPGDLDMMREAGKQIALRGAIDPDAELDVDIPELRESMARRHHEKWYAQFLKDIESGKRKDFNHRGAKPYDELPPIEREILKVQTWANWRVLGSLSDDEYALVRGLSEARANS